MLNVKNINQDYGGSHILRNVSLQAHPGKGVGKTTLLKSLMGLVPIKTGHRLRRQANTEFDALRTRALRYRLRPARPRNFRAADRKRKFAHRPGLQKCQHTHPRRTI